MNISMRHRPSLLDIDLSVLERHLMPCLGVEDLFHLSLTCKTLRERVMMLPNMPYEVRPDAQGLLPAGVCVQTVVIALAFGASLVLDDHTAVPA